MGRYIVTGGNSGIGLEIGRQLAAKGHQVVLIGRDAAKCEAAKASIPSSEAISGDLSTHAGVRAVAGQLAAAPIDGLVHSAGYLSLEDTRTADGLNPVFAVNYLARYHLTQLLRPQLEAAAKPTVVLIVAGVPLDTKIDFTRFPRFDPFPGMSALPQIQLANHHWAQHVAQHDPKLKIGLCNVGLAKTGIMRAMPLVFRAGFTVLVPLIGVSVEKAASNPVHLSTSEGWESGSYWPKPGKPGVSQKLALDAATVEKVVAASRELTGV